ncbi:MAG: UDP-N-acetylmuramoyl-L-alanine--D-glutamate ligase, partial [Actinomycetota bacterium]|nr:UDP-N-acetylmuramoyl-L-alanine--D-glutamate ligase [Actinomycetota bacterium]
MSAQGSEGPQGPGGVPWEGRRVCVAGIRVVGRAAGRVLRDLGADVTIVDDGTGELQQRHGRELTALGVRVRLGNGSSLPRPAPDLLVVSPGFRPDAPLVRAAEAAGVPVWGDVELAWRLRPPGAAPWLCLTGTNGKTTTVQMLAEMLRAAGRRTVAAGNVGLPLLEAVLAPEPYDVLAVELSSFQLHYTSSLRPLASAVLNLAPDHLDWHGGMAAYAAAKARVYAGTEVACVYNLDDPHGAHLLGAAPRGARAVGFTLAAPAPG